MIKVARSLVVGAMLLCTHVVQAENRLVVYAASSLTTALSEASTQFEMENGVKITHSFASSATLAKQIEAGAPVDIFVSANTKWMDYLQANGYVDPASRKNWLGNRLVLIVPRGRSFPVEFERGHDFAATFEGRLCMGNVESVPAGIYAKQALMSFNWWGDIKPRVVETQDVRAALAFVERGECAASIVYESDARISDKVQIAGVFPESSHQPIIYPIAFVAGAKSASRNYWQYLQSPAGAAVFHKHGFRVIE